MCNDLLLLAITDVWYDTSGFQIQLNGILSRKLRILSPQKGGYSSQKGISVEKTSIFDVFGKSLIDK